MARSGIIYGDSGSLKSTAAKHFSHYIYERTGKKTLLLSMDGGGWGPMEPEIQAGITALVSAKASLVKAGDKWGGHRVKAIGLIDKALKACGQPQTHVKGEMTSGSTDDAASLQAGTTELTTAQKDFTNSKNTWGGRRDQALALINQALQELQLATNAANKPKKSS